MIVWDIASGKKLRTFSAETPESESGTSPEWPMFKFSPDERYIARLSSVGIQVYELPTMNLLEKKAIQAENIQDFQWSPKDNTLAYWTPESGNIPARITLMKVPSREIIRTKNLFSVQQVKLHWHPNGDYMLMDVTQFKKKQTTSHFEIFRLREKGIPIDVMDRKSAENISQVAWEPQGKKFGVIASEGLKNTVYFYELITAQDKNLSKIDAGIEIALLNTHEARGINTISWSPIGRYCILASLKASSGTLEFWDTSSMTLMSSSDHELCTHLEWDPSGRFVASLVSFWHTQSDNGYILWTFTGTLLLKQNIPVMKQFIWRPRPESLLSEERKKEIKKNMKKYTVAFEKEDRLRKNKADRDVVERRQQLWEEWIAFRTKAQAKLESQTEERIKIWGFDPAAKEDVADEDLEQVIEEIIEEKEEIME